MNSPKDVLDKLQAGDFASLVGIAESEWLDAKEMPYLLDTQKRKLELAKDVSAFANAGGGIIVIGFDCSKNASTAAEYISKVCPFPLTNIDVGRYKNILADLIYPPLHGLAIETFDAPVSDGTGVAAIFIDSKLATERPYLVGKMLDETDQGIGAYCGYFERKRDIIPTLNIAQLQHMLAAGQQWSSINQRLSAIESNVNSWSAAKPPRIVPGISKAEREKRLKAARIALGRDDAPIVYFTATPEGECDFPDLFKSRSERIVRLIENPPTLRPNGFGIWADRTAEIVQGRFRRNMLEGDRLLELWRDGLFIFVAPGDEDFLGWSISDATGRPIRISNFVLAEATLMFCWFMRLIYDEANPKPPTIRLSVGFDNMFRDDKSATLYDVPEGRVRGFGEPKPAPGPEREFSELVAWDDYDPAEIAYKLVEHVYHWFGYESQAMPFVDRVGSKSKLSTIQIIEKALPQDPIPTPGYV